MTDLLLLLLGVAGQFGLGIAIALSIAGSRLLSIPIRPFGFMVARAELLGLGFVLGIGGTSYLQLIWSLSGGRLGREFSLGLAVGGIVLGLLAWGIVRRGARSATPLSSVVNDDSGIHLARCCALLIVAVTSFALIQSLLTPQKFWDERAFYGLKAIVLFEDHSIRSADLANADFVQGHPRYPLLISLAEQHLYAVLGHVDDRLVKILFPLLFVGLVLTTGGVLTRRMSVGRAWLGAVLLATIPVLMPDDYGFLCGQADAPIACLEGIALLYLWDSLHGLTTGLADQSTSRTSLILAAVTASLGAFTKDEGISHSAIHSLAFLTVLSLWGLIQNRKPQRESSSPKNLPSAAKFSLFAIAVLILVPALVLAPWFVHRRSLPLTGEMNYFGRMSVETILGGVPTLSWSVPHLLWRMFGEVTLWGLQWWFLAITLFAFPVRAIRTPQIFLLLTLLGQLSALLLAGMIAPVALEEHIGGSSHRYLMQLAPAVLLFAMGQLSTRTANELHDQ